MSGSEDAAIAFGSSPLARGLRGRASLPRGLIGIIPARAGFTMGPRTACTPTPDHPRSRGVYFSSGMWSMCQTGSSPLARGLRTRRDHHRGARRIIPARAGFTTARGAWTSCHRDHPRSRGVYLAAVYGAVTGKGSSPLARGLLGKKGKAVREAGIIPARAGFTDKADNRRRMATDHPRSRGVYLTGWERTRASPGSSPLARGLRRAARRLQGRRRIIPARAGFTQAGDPPPRHRPDHPRSRGVYPSSTPTRASSSGSSPLARGLPGGRAGPASGHRIIPARAGFTQVAIASIGTATDHPRSRGVYAHPIHERVRHYGSSPLARGLPVDITVGAAVMRIIPARAGFTDERRLKPATVADHPRSRGVYFLQTAAPACYSGSSPLARGLPGG